MRALLLKLTSMDSDAEAALRVIAYFDALSVRSATAEMVVRGAAAISEATAGLVLADGTVLRFDASGARMPGRQPTSRALQYSVGELHAWIERKDAVRSLDELVLERFALAAKSAVRERAGATASELADPTVFEMILSSRESVEERSLALRRIGLSPESTLIVLAVADEQPREDRDRGLEEALRRASTLGRARGARLASLGIVLVQTHPSDESRSDLQALREALCGTLPAESASFRCGISAPVSALDVTTGWDSARSALSFARPKADRAHAVEATELGAITALAAVPANVWMADWRVRALRELAETDTGRIDLDILETYLTQGSLRMSGQVLHMHHSSVAARLARLEEKLNLNFSAQPDLFQARLCLYAAVLVENN